MKPVFALIVLASFLASNLLAGPDAIIEQRARELRNQNNVRQGVASPAQRVQPAAAPTASASPTPVQQSIARLRADLKAIKPNAPVPASEKGQITKDLIALAQGANKPSEATAGNLAGGLATAFAQKPLSDRECSRLLSDLAAVLNPANIPPTSMQAVHADIQAIFQANGMERKDAVKILDQVKAAGTEAR